MFFQQNSFLLKCICWGFLALISVHLTGQTGPVSVYGPDSIPHICSKHQSVDSWNQINSVINPNPLMSRYDVTFYKLDLTATDTINQFSGFATVVVEVVDQPLDTFSIELHNKLVVDSVLINGELHSFIHTGNNITIGMNQSAGVGELINFTVFYHTPSGYTSNYYSTGQNPDYGNFYVTQSFSEPYGAHEWMPCKQELNDKADSVHIFITTDSSLLVAGPGLVTRIPLPEGKIRHEWRCYYPTAYYLIAFAVSDYEEYIHYSKPNGLPDDSILIQNLVFDYPNCLENNKVQIDKTPAMVELLSDLYGLYPFHQGKYGHYMWYPSSFSGMEHITMSGMRYFNTYLISHELGHSWFGDNVTCATWSDIWINEGFATYTQYLILEYLYSKASADNQMTTYMNSVMSQPGGSVYVPPESLNSVGRIFSTRLSYRKGGALVHMIRFEMNNDSLFFQTLQNFQEEFKDSIATGLDFKQVCEEVSGLDFDDFFDQWYFGEGFPTYSVIWSQEADTLILEVSQIPSTDVTPLFKMPMEYGISWTDGDTVIRKYHFSNDTLFSIVLPHEITNITIDPENRVLNGEGEIQHRKHIQLKAFLEGAYDTLSGTMVSDMGPTMLPSGQPYNQPPWNYPEEESVPDFPPDVIDWVLVEFYDTTSADLVTEEVRIHRTAGLLLANGQITGLDGQIPLTLDKTVHHNLFVVLHHRNHLRVLSAIPMEYSQGTFFYDFSLGMELVLGGDSGYSPILPGIWGMAAGDTNADGIIDENDITTMWTPISGEKGYLSADLNLDGQANNQDKDDWWWINRGKESEF